MSDPRRLEVLIADVPAMEDVLRSCFSGDHVTYAGTYEDAVRGLQEQPFDIVVVGVDFDCGRCGQLVLDVRLSDPHGATPVVCVHGLPSPRSGDEATATRKRLIAMGADEFIEFGLSSQELEILYRRLNRARRPRFDRRIAA